MIIYRNQTGNWFENDGLPTSRRPSGEQHKQRSILDQSCLWIDIWIDTYLSAGWLLIIHLKDSVCRMFLKCGTFDKMEVKVPRKRRMKESPMKRIQVQLAIFCWVEQEGEGEEKEGDEEDGNHLEPASHCAAQTHTSAKLHWGLRPLLKGGIQTHTTSQMSLLPL